MIERTWIKDDNGNKCSVEYWGTEQAAREALATLRDCSRCSDCSDCSDCWDCSGCSRCSRCSDCSDCSDCSRCSDCSDCSDCWDCSDCSDCWDCSGCSRCSRCSDCSDCSDCWDCSGCSRCSRCSDCSDMAPAKATMEIPTIESIHTKVYEAASKPNALDMGNWHACDTTHCRAGWVVHLAGPAGYALEEKTSALFAAMQIYKASGSPISPCRFFDSSENALADMKRLADEEAASK